MKALAVFESVQIRYHRCICRPGTPGQDRPGTPRPTRQVQERLGTPRPTGKTQTDSQSVTDNLLRRICQILHTSVTSEHHSYNTQLSYSRRYSTDTLKYFSSSVVLWIRNYLFQLQISTDCRGLTPTNHRVPVSIFYIYLRIIPIFLCSWVQI